LEVVVPVINFGTALKNEIFFEVKVKKNFFLIASKRKKQ
jgi:hypothetical protein